MDFVPENAYKVHHDLETGRGGAARPGGW